MHLTSPYSGRTEYQTATMNRARRSVRFERKPSQRFSRRATFERKEREERVKKDQEKKERLKEGKERLRDDKDRIKEDRDRYPSFI